MEYITEEESYIWLQQDLGTFAKSGFYDWVLFQLRPTGKHSVNKIVDLQQAKPMDSSREELFANNVSVRSVKGRYIVHPAEVRQLQLH